MFPVLVTVTGMGAVSKLDPTGPAEGKASELQRSAGLVQPRAAGEDSTTLGAPR
jgi:hypothetical protein